MNESARPVTPPRDHAVAIPRPGSIIRAWDQESRASVPSKQSVGFKSREG